MDKVYLLRDISKLKTHTRSLIKNIFQTDSEVLIKIHFGEPRNKCAFKPRDVKPIIDAAGELKLKPVFIDSPVFYSSPRETVKGYTRVVKDKGYNKLAPYIISNAGIQVKTKDFTANVIRELVQSEGVLVISHVKGHVSSGFSAAIKNLGMGGVTKKTKELIHTLGQPELVGKCNGCGICASLCPAGAIKIFGDEVKFNLDKCHGCSICQLVCPNRCLEPKKAIFDDLLAQSASAVIEKLPKRTYYINFLMRISRKCDCHQDSGELISDDIGILFSKNPVAIDKASVDLVNKLNKEDVFRKGNHKDPFLHINFAEKYSGLSSDYELIRK